MPSVMLIFLWRKKDKMKNMDNFIGFLMGIGVGLLIGLLIMFLYDVINLIC